MLITLFCKLMLTNHHWRNEPSFVIDEKRDDGNERNATTELLLILT